MAETFTAASTTPSPLPRRIMPTSAATAASHRMVSARRFTE